MAGLNIEILIKAQDQASSTLGNIGKALGGLGTVGLGLAAGGLAAAGAALVGVGAIGWKAANELDAAFDNIVIGTGATGDALEGLKDDFKRVFTGIPTDAATASSVIAELNTRLGLTDDALVNLSKPLLEASRMLGGDATKNAQLFGRVMGDWDLPVSDAAGALDKFFAAGQATGAGMDELMSKVVQFGAPMRLMGFSLDDAIALFGKWEKEGVNAELVMGSLRIAAGKFADAGVPLRESLLATFDSIKNNEDASQALADAMDVFGARAGPDMAAAIREGRFEFEDLLEVLGDSEGAIMDTAAATMDWGEKLEMMKNKAFVALEPIGSLMMDLASDILDDLGPAIDDLTAWLGEALPVAISIARDFWTNTLQPAIKAVWQWMSTVLIPFLQNQVFPWLQTYIPVALQFLSDTWTKVLKPAIEAVWNWLSTVLIPFLQNTVYPWLKENIPIALQFLSDVWTNVLQPAIEAVWNWLSTVLMPFLQNVVFPWLQENIPAALQTLSDFWTNTLLPAIQAVWGFINDQVLPLLGSLIDLFFAVGDVIVELSGKYREVLMPVLNDVWTFLKENVWPIFERIAEWWRNILFPILGDLANIWLKGVVQSFDGVTKAIQGVVDWFQKMADKISDFKLPDWLVRKSPSPFEMSFLGAADAIGKLVSKELPDLQVSLRAIKPPENIAAPVRAVAGATNDLVRTTIDNRKYYYLTAQYPYQSPADIARDVRMMELLAQ
jgi:hypothetical protein